MKPILKNLLAGGVVLLLSGCASLNINPETAQPQTGYVDFYAVNADNLCWDIMDVQRNRKVFYEFDPVREPILRLAFKPGEYQLNVTFLNHVIMVPGTVQVQVRDGLVTPVTVTLAETGTVMVETKQRSLGSTYYGNYGRRTKISDNGSASYEVKVEPQSPLPYQPKAQMPYLHAPDQ